MGQGLHGADWAKEGPFYGGQQRHKIGRTNKLRQWGGQMSRADSPSRFDRIGKWLITAICTFWIIPVSCTSIAMGGASALSHLTQETYKESSETVSPGFMVAVAPGQEGAPFEVVPLRGLKSHLDTHPGTHTLMPVPMDSVTYEDGGASYAVNGPFKADTQEIEVENRGSSSNTYSVYKVSAKGVEPMAFRGFSVGHAVICAILGLWLGALLQKKATNWLDKKFFRKSEAPKSE